MNTLKPKRGVLRLLNPNPLAPPVETYRQLKRAAGLPVRAYKDVKGAVSDLVTSEASKQQQALDEARVIDLQRAREGRMPEVDPLAEARARFEYHAQARGLGALDIAQRLRQCRRVQTAYLVGLVLVAVFACLCVVIGSIGAAALLAFALLPFLVGAAHQALHIAQLDERALISWVQFASRADLFKRLFNPWCGGKTAPVLKIQVL